MSGFSILNWGICWYFANSASQAAADDGGSAPVTGFHSVIDSPDPVSRVAPPSAIIATTMTNRTTSHARIAPRAMFGPPRAPASIRLPAGTVWAGVACDTSSKMGRLAMSSFLLMRRDCDPGVRKRQSCAAGSCAPASWRGLPPPVHVSWRSIP